MTKTNEQENKKANFERPEKSFGSSSVKLFKKIFQMKWVCFEMVELEKEVKEVWREKRSGKNEWKGFEPMFQNGYGVKWMNNKKGKEFIFVKVSNIPCGKTEILL